MPPSKKNEMSEPSFEAISFKRVKLIFKLNNLLKPSITDAQLLDPPPNPEPIGMFLDRSIETGLICGNFFFIS